MNWERKNSKILAKSNDGYELVVLCENEHTYKWLVYFNKKIINNINKNSTKKKSLQQAKRQAIRVMIKHMLQKIDNSH